MRQLILFLSAALVALPVQAIAISVAQGAPAGTVTRLRGDASAEAAGQTRALAQDSTIELGDRLHTGADARLEVKFIDGTVLTLGEKADFTIDALSVGPQSGEALFTRTAGAIRLLAGQIAKLPEHRVEVAGNAATIGIRGTDVWGGTVKPGSLLDVFLIEGAVDVRTPGGTVVLDKPGLGTSVTAPGGVPQEPATWQPALRDQALATVSFSAP